MTKNNIGMNGSAELPPPVDHAPRRDRARIHVEGRTIDMVIARQKPRQDRRLIVKPRPLPETLDLLQRNDFGAIDDARDAIEVIAAVAAEAVLNVVADQLHANAPPPGRVLSPARPGWQAAASVQARRP